MALFLPIPRLGVLALVLADFSRYRWPMMRLNLAFLLALLACPAFAQSEGGSSSATIPVIHSDEAKPSETVIKPVPIVPTQTPAEIAADAAQRKQADQDISDYAARISDACDANLKARIDWTTVSPMQIHRYSPADACGAALQAIEELCQNPAAKPRVAQGIKSVICTNGDQPSVEIHAGTLVYTIDWQSPNPGTRVYTWLATHL